MSFNWNNLTPVVVILFHFTSCSLDVDRSKIPRETSKLSNTFDNSTCIYILLQTLPLPLLSFYVSLRTITPPNSSIFAYFNVLNSILVSFGEDAPWISWFQPWRGDRIRGPSRGKHFRIYIYISRKYVLKDPLYFSTKR